MPEYTTLEFYLETYSGGGGAVIDAALFSRYNTKASLLMKQYTFNRISEPYSDVIQMCCCELAEYLYKKEVAENGTEAGAKGVITEKTGEYSVSYETTKDREKAHTEAIKRIIHTWLSDTGLLYRGC